MMSAVDMLGVSGVLRGSRVPRTEFDPTNGDHLASVRTFLATGNWGQIQFYPEAPYVSVPETVFRKLANWALQAAGY